ncbi:MAG TPA: hypothetical protein VIJ62_10675 [Rhizomicrobium sp.]
MRFQRYLQNILVPIAAISFFGFLALLRHYSEQPANRVAGGLRDIPYRYGSAIFYLNPTEALPVRILEYTTIVLIPIIIFAALVICYTASEHFKSWGRSNKSELK